ncbi:unnamed protein product [Leptosia nina]|uniref:Acyltransferase 3 domain-containing protein n=1 Tax=Leptosia nina TaxID=320188 RepID=A0AAV1JLM2_9NEOP
MKFLIFVLVIVSFEGVIGSKIEINDTLIEWFPPLYALDEWATCQHPMDEYCLVDAVLYSDKPSKLLDTLTAYSSEVAKHYNRTQIHRGVCMSKCPVNGTDKWEVAQSCVNRSIQPYDLEARVTSVNWCSTPGGQRASGAARAMGVIMVTLLVMTVAATVVSLVDYKMGNKVLMAFSLTKNWQSLFSGRPSSEARFRDFNVLDGVKALGIQSVIFTHIMLLQAYAYVDNPDFIERIYDKLTWKVGMNTPLFLQAFFTMTGFMTAYMTLVIAEKRRISFTDCLFSIISRIIRLGPLVIFTLGFTIFWFPLMGSSPHWTWLVGREVHDCSNIWWHFFVFGENFTGTKNYCLSHLWYVAIDLQFHIFGVLFLFLFLRYRRFAIPVLTAIVIGTGLAAGIVHYRSSYTPIITGQHPETLRTVFEHWEQIRIIYTPPWMNPGFFIGLIVGFIHYNNQEKGIKLSEKTWFNILFKTSLHLAMVVAALGVFFLSDNPPPIWVGGVYSALDRPLVSVFLSIFILGLVSKCKSLALSILSWSGFQAMGKLAYCAYIVHFIVLRLIFANNMRLIHVNIFYMIFLQISATVLTYLISIPMYLLIELPFVKIWKSAFEAPKPQSKVNEEPATLKVDHSTNVQNDV